MTANYREIYENSWYHQITKFYVFLQGMEVAKIEKSRLIALYMEKSRSLNGLRKTSTQRYVCSY